ETDPILEHFYYNTFEMAPCSQTAKKRDVVPAAVASANGRCPEWSRHVIRTGQNDSGTFGQGRRQGPCTHSRPGAGHACHIDRACQQHISLGRKVITLDHCDWQVAAAVIYKKLAQVLRKSEQATGAHVCDQTQIWPQIECLVD